MQNSANSANHDTAGSNTAGNAAIRILAHNVLASLRAKKSAIRRACRAFNRTRLDNCVLLYVYRRADTMTARGMDMDNINVHDTDIAF